MSDPKQKPPCLFCGVKGGYGIIPGKHKETCDLYHSIEPERCALAHTPFLRSIEGPTENRVYEYECNFCNIEPEFGPEKKGSEHPLCLEGKHWPDSCGDGCCEPWCKGCGKAMTWDSVYERIKNERLRHKR